MGFPETPIPKTGDLAADNQRSERSLLCADPNGQTLRVLGVVDGTTGNGGRLEVVVTDDSGNFPLTQALGLALQDYGEANSLASFGVATTISYTVPVGKIAFINHVSFSGENIAVWDGIIDGVTIIRKRTTVTNLNDDFLFHQSGNGFGLRLTAGQIFRVDVENNGASAADFNTHLGGVEFDTP